MERFRLQTALDVRKRLEKLKQKEYAQQLQVAKNLEVQIAQAQQSIAQSDLQADSLKTGILSVQVLQEHNAFKKRLLYQINLLQQRLQEQNQLVESKRSEVAQAGQKRRALEIIKEKRELLARKKQEQLERSQMDEIAQNHVLKQNHQV